MVWYYNHCILYARIERASDRPTDRPQPMNIHIHMRWAFLLLSRTGISSLFPSLHLACSFFGKHFSRVLLLNTYVQSDVYTSELLSCTGSLAAFSFLISSFLSLSLYLIRSILQVFSWLLRSMFNFISTVVCGVRSLQQWESVLCQIVL